MDTKSVEKLNINPKFNLSRIYNWIEVNCSTLFKEALNEFWETDVECKLTAVDENKGFFFSGSEYFVTRIKLTKGKHFTIRLSMETVKSFLDKTLGNKPDFKFEKITELEAKILTDFSNFIYEKFSSKIILKEERTDLEGEIYLTFLLKNSDENSTKIIINLPKSFLDYEEVFPSDNRFDLSDFPQVKTKAGIYVGATTLPLNDVKNLEKEDIIMLEESNINNMTLLFNDEKKEFRVSPEPALIVGFDNNEGNKTMSKSNNIWDDILVDITAEFEGVKVSLGEIKQISEGLVVDMGSLYENKVYLKVENKTIAEGELVIINDRYGVKVDKIIDDKAEGKIEISKENEEAVAENIETEEIVSESDLTQEEEKIEEFDYKDFDVDDENI